MDSISRTHPAFRDAPTLALRGEHLSGLRQAARFGTAFGKELVREQRLPGVRELFQRTFINAGRSGPLAVRRVRYAVVLLAAYQAIAQSGDRRAKRVPQILRQWLRGTAVNILVLLLPRLGRRARLALRGPQGLPQHLLGPWQEAYTTAVAAARVAQACTDLGAEVMLATPGERLSLRLDLLVRAAGVGLCVRVHPEAADQRFCARRLQDAEPPFLMQGDADRLRLSARLFSQVNGGSWVPVAIDVGEPFGIESLTLPRHARRRLARLLTLEEDATQSAA